MTFPSCCPVCESVPKLGRTAGHRDGGRLLMPPLCPPWGSHCSLLVPLNSPESPVELPRCQTPPGDNSCPTCALPALLSPLCLPTDEFLDAHAAPRGIPSIPLLAGDGEGKAESEHVRIYLVSPRQGKFTRNNSSGHIYLLCAARFPSPAPSAGQSSGKRALSREIVPCKHRQPAC